MDLAIAGFFAIYFAPSVVAAYRDHPHELRIFVVTLLFAWTVVGWLGALWWAAHPPRRAQPSGVRRRHLRVLEGAGR